MPCTRPLTLSTQITRKLFHKGYIKYSSISVPCGHCLECRIAKQSSLIFLAQKELLTRYRDGQGASFVTLTYDDNHIPINNRGMLTLRKSDLQKFMKRLRRNMEYHYGKTIDFKFVACGEYGDKFSRPHYHVCFLGLSDNEVRQFSKKVWKFGICDIGPLGQGGLRYVCKYMTKKLPTKEIKKIYDDNDCERPFITHSIGLGRKWLCDHIQEISDNNYMFNVNGKLQFFPKFVMRFVMLRTGKDYRKIVSDYITKDNARKAYAAGYTDYDSYADEQNYIRHVNNIACMRSRGIAVDDDSLVLRSYYRPKHYKDRLPMINLAREALEASYCDKVPF